MMYLYNQVVAFLSMPGITFFYINQSWINKLSTKIRQIRY